MDDKTLKSIVIMTVVAFFGLIAIGIKYQHDRCQKENKHTYSIQEVNMTSFEIRSPDSLFGVLKYGTKYSHEKISIDIRDRQHVKIGIKQICHIKKPNECGYLFNKFGRILKCKIVKGEKRQ